MSAKDKFIDDAVEDTVAGYDAVLPAAAQKELRALMHDLFQADPVLGPLTSEQAPPEQVYASEEVAVDPEVVEAAKRKGHG